MHGRGSVRPPAHSMATLPTLSLAHLTVLPAGPLELIDAAAAAGFDAVGLRVQPPLPGDKIAPVAGDQPLLREMKRRLKASGVTVIDIEAFWLNPESDVAGFKPGLEAGVELGASGVIVVGNDPERSRLLDRFGRFCEMSTFIGLRPMFEFIPYSQVRSLPETQAFLAAAGVTNCGILVDALHLSRSGGSPADIAKYPAELFSYVHLCDAPMAPPPPHQLRAEARGERSFPGDGELWLKDFVQAFPAGTPAAVEVPSARHAGLAPTEKAKLAIDRTRRLFRELGC